MPEYFVGSTYLGSSPAKAGDSLAYFCRCCGEIWGRILAGPEWQILHVPCEAHTPSAVSDWGKFPGSFLNNFMHQDRMGKWAWASAIESLPLPALQREVRIHLDLFEKGVQDG